MKANEKPILDVIQYTDPYCTWCWGSEPVMRHIEEAYGNQVRIGFVMGGLVKDVTQFHDPLNRIGGPGMAEQVAEHWEEASRRHGMPVDEQVFLDMKDEFRSTWPANIAFKAAQMQNSELANKFLRRMREAAAAERKFVHRREVQSALAQEIGLDHERFITDIDNGTAELAFQRDLEECRDKHVTGFPSFLIRNQEGEEFMFFGFQPFSKFVDLFERLAPGRLIQKAIVVDEENIVDFIRRYGKVAWRELSEVFSLTRGEVDDWTGRLEKKGLITKEKAGSGWFFTAPLGPGNELRGVGEG